MKIKMIILLISIFLLTGCYDRKELNKLAILTATEINKIDDEFIINAQIVNPQSPDKTTNVESPFFIYTGKGKTIQEAYRQIKLSSSRYIYPDHLRILIINEKLAKEDISQILDFYLRDPAIRTEFNILIGKNENILSPITPLEQISASSIIDSLEVNKNYLGVTNQTSLNELAIMYLNPTLSYTILYSFLSHFFLLYIKGRKKIKIYIDILIRMQYNRIVQKIWRERRWANDVR